MRKNYLAGIIALMILILAAVPAMGEISAKNTEANGKITETVWVDDSGNPAAGILRALPAFVRQWFY